MADFDTGYVASSHVDITLPLAHALDACSILRSSKQVRKGFQQVGLRCGAAFVFLSETYLSSVMFALDGSMLRPHRSSWLRGNQRSGSLTPMRCLEAVKVVFCNLQ